MTLSPSRQVAISRGLCCVEDIDLIQEIVNTKQPRITVIIGAGSGTMSLGFLEARIPHLQYLHSIDISSDSLWWELEAWKIAGWAGAQGEWPENASQQNQDSSRAGRQWAEMNTALGANRDVDFLVIDGDHSEDGVRKDLESWLPNMSDKATIMLHDYDAEIAPEQYPGVKVAADELLRDWQFQGKQGWSAWWTR